jgi:hypothetical protein
VDKAIFIKDVEAYKSMRFESARRKIAKLLYQRFVSPEGENGDLKFPKGSSVFSLIRQERAAEADEKSHTVPPGADGKDQPGRSIAVQTPSAAAAANSPAAAGGAGGPASAAMSVPGTTNPSASVPQASLSPTPLNASGPGAAAAAAMLNPPSKDPNAIAMTKLGPGHNPGGPSVSVGDKEVKELHKPGGGSSEQLPAALSPAPQVPGDTKQAADAPNNALHSPTQPGRSSQTPITMNITTPAPTSHDPSKPAHDTKEHEKTVISTNGQHTTTHVHSHNSATMKVGVVGGGAGNATLGGERIEFQIGTTNNAIGVYGKIVKRVKERVQKVACGGAWRAGLHGLA